MLMLLERDVHVWNFDLNLDLDQINHFSQFLTAQERQRAAKLINPLHGNRWTVARGYLRQILSQYLDRSPADVVFRYGQQGKPAVEGEDLQFNLSHSGDRAVYAISAKYPVGIDLEYIHPLPATDLVDRFFSANERAIFHRLPVSLQQAAFFHAWTQKEAYLKACGTGLSTPLDQIEVSIDPRTPAEIISAPIAGIWQIQRLEISTEYVGAIVIGGDSDDIKYSNPNLIFLQ
ncbi:MAG: 4'-phosphopantetheinyl transferase superfamily protein [Chamaesiphon sp.]|nr:4'-phosphopantetheinyl transferase superfamily protein [Chamaesiphon sp.]